MIYAIGDVHGTLHLLEALLERIKEDAAGLGIDRPSIVLLGDMIDRGLQSKEVIDLLISPAFKKNFDVTALKGNHEDTLLKVLKGDAGLLVDWMHWGGAETIESYGVVFGTDSPIKVLDKFRKVLPQVHIDFLKSLPVTHRHEDWLFVHAGLRPSVPLEHQRDKDLLWILDDFLNHKGDFGVGAMIVHGHARTKSGEVEIFPNRIAVDTGAGYRDGKLSAVRLEKGMAVKTLSVG